MAEASTAHRPSFGGWSVVEGGGMLLPTEACPHLQGPAIRKIRLGAAMNAAYLLYH